MALADRYRDYGSFSPPSVPSAVKWLIIVNTGVWLAMFLANAFSPAAFQVFRPLGLVPFSVLNSFAVWQVFTYMFLHDPAGITHILFNMLTLWMIGSTLESRWGSARFLKFYLYCGLGAGICILVVNYALGLQFTWTIGASGAIYGILLAFGVLYPDAPMLFMFLFSMKAKYMVMLLGAIAFLLTITMAGGGVSHIAHLGGLVVGWILLKYTPMFQAVAPRRRGPGLSEQLSQQYRDWKLRRAKKKFQVYLKQRGARKPDDWMN